MILDIENRSDHFTRKIWRMTSITALQVEINTSTNRKFGNTLSAYIR